MRVHEVIVTVVVVAGMLLDLWDWLLVPVMVLDLLVLEGFIAFTTGISGD